MRVIRSILIILVVSLALSVMPAFSQQDSRIGVGFGKPNYVLIYRPGNFDFKGGYDFTEGNEFVYLSGGYRFVDNRHLNGPLHFSLGIGGFGRFSFGDASSMETITGGMQLPVGMSVMVFDRFLEFFVEVAPGIDLYPRPGFADVPLQAWAGVTLQVN